MGLSFLSMKNDLKPLYTSDSQMHTLANSEDPEKMLHNAAFHQGLHYLQSSKNNLQKKKYNFSWNL